MRFGQQRAARQVHRDAVAREGIAHAAVARGGDRLVDPLRMDRDRTAGANHGA